MTNADHSAVWKRLYRELARAETEHYRIQEEMNRILLGTPCGAPLTDGQYRKMKAGAAARAAYEDYQRAIEQFRGFVDEGIIPDDVKER
jgi:hypothetical protein